jgi:inosine triphosphate pyrophosphatase
MHVVTLITGNQAKADYAQKLLGYPIAHHKLDLEEIQSMDQLEVVEHKLIQAFNILNKPVLVEDVSLEFEALGRLPGTFIKFFEQELGHEKLCRLLDNKSRNATAICTYGYTDGVITKFFSSEIKGTIALNPRGKHAFGFDVIFIPKNSDKTRAECSEAEYAEYYLRLKPFDQIKVFLESLN